VPVIRSSLSLCGFCLRKWRLAFCWHRSSSRYLVTKELRSHC
jgi:hypothetical protein